MKRILLLAAVLLSFSLAFSQNLQISGGNSFSAAVCDNQQVFVWGSNQSGQLGIDASNAPIGDGYRNTPESVLRGNVSNTVGGLTYGNLPAIRQIDAGSGAHILGLSCADQVWAWGENDQGQLGRNATGDSPIPQRVLRGEQAQTIDAVNDPNGVFLNNIFYVSGGNNSSFALEEGTGRVLAWGQNGNGQLGNGTTTDQLTPVYVLTGPGTQLTNIVQIEGGDICTYALDADGYVWSWGNNDGNKLGRPGAGDQVYAARVVKGDPLNSGYSATPTPTQYLDNIVQISGGDTHCLALDANGNVWSFGGDWGEGQLGRGGGSVYQDDARRVVRPGLAAYATAEADFLGNGSDGKAIYVSAGQASSAVVLSNGRVVTFGGRGLFNAGPTDMGDGSPAISCPTPAGDMIVSGTLGDNATDCNSSTCDGKATKFSRTPVYVMNSSGSILTGITQISDGDAWYYAISSTGTAYTWGWNRRGELGLGDYSDRCRATAFTLPSGCAFSDPCPGQPILGADVETCPVFSTVLNSNVPQTYTSWKYTWEYKASLSDPTWTSLATNSDDVTYSSATQYGYYRVYLADNRGTVPFLCAPCPVLMDTILFSPVPSPYTVTGCVDASANLAQFEVTNPPGSLIKWYTDPTGGTALNPSDTDPSIIVPFANTNTSIPGCARALFAEDVSSISGALMSAQPCAAASGGNVNGSFFTMITANQDASLTEVSFVQGGGWGGGTWELRIYDNIIPSSIWCADCSPNGNYNGPNGAAGTGTLIATTSAFPDPGTSAVRTWTLPTPYDITAGTYWLEISVSGGAIRPFTCSSPTLTASTNLWTTPLTEPNNVLVAKSAIIGNNSRNYGGLFNIKYQAGASYSCDRILVCATGVCTLPVELTHFNAVSQGTSALLSWATSKEVNSSHFIVLKSTNGINFTEIGKISAAGNSSSEVQYSFVDPNLSVGTTYYRLAQYDVDGKVHFSEIRSVSREGINGVKIVPNPNNGSFQVVLEGLGEKSARLILLNSLSQEVYSAQSAGGSSGINIEHLPSGVYYLQVVSENGIIVEKIVKE